MKAYLATVYKEIAGTLEWLGGTPRMASNELLVVCLHSTPRDRMPQFERLVDDLLKRFTPMSPAQLSDYFARKTDFQNGPYVLFTFDDGLRNNVFNAQALHARGIQAIYFLVPAFHAAADGEQYYTTHIRPTPDYAIDHEREDRTPMNASEIEAIIRMGHEVGSHTLTHRLRADMSVKEVEEEIAEGKKALEQMVGQSIRMFASPNNTFFSVNKEASQIIASQFPFHFVTFPGSNARDGEPQMILRRNIEVHWGKGRVKLALGNFDLRRWLPAVHRYRAEHLSNLPHPPFP